MHNFNDIKLLLIEDNPGDARLISENLKEIEKINFNITHAVRLKDAIELIKKNKYDVALLDLGLPDSQGYDTFISIRENSRNIPFVLLTGINDENIAIKAVQDGAQDYLSKDDVTASMLAKSILYAIERNQLLVKLKEQSILDELTGLYNRRGFSELFDQAYKKILKDKNDLLVVYCDIDGLKQINDTFGHNIGDNAIITVSQILRQSFSSCDVIARLGGDEFAAFSVMNNTSVPEMIINKIKELVDIHNSKGVNSYPLSISIGYDIYRSNSEKNMDELLRDADKGMYLEKLAKKKGVSRNQ